MLVQFQVNVALRWAVAAVPSPGVNKEPILEDEEVRIPGISLWHTKRVHLLPLTGILARQDDYRRVGADPMSIRATPEREVEHTFEHSQIRERIVVAIVKYLSDVADVYLRGIGERDLRQRLMFT